jgi:large subunit ribosomal protein L20
MVRIKTNVYSHRRKKRVLKEARGQFGDRSKRYKEAIKSLIASRQYAYFDRKKKKSEYRSLWIIRLNAACRESGITYSRFINGLKNAQITLDRKVLADLAVTEPEIFAQIIEQAKSGKPPVAEAVKITDTPKATVKKIVKKTVKKTVKKA